MMPRNRRIATKPNSFCSHSLPSIFCNDENKNQSSSKTFRKKSFCDIKMLSMILKTILLVVFYYSFSIGITFYQKWFLMDFKFPLTCVLFHLVVKFILSALFRLSNELITGQNRILLGWSIYFKQLALTGLASALDIGFSNWSFQFITISLYTMTKSTCVIFILGFSLLLGLEKKRPSLLLVVLLISVGLCMFTYKSTQFNLMGFLLVLSASFLGGLRWTLAQFVMQRKDIGLSHPIDMIYHVQPWMILGIFPLVATIEGIPIATSEHLFRYSDPSQLLFSVYFMLFGSCIAFLMEVSEYLLLTYTSSLTLSIAGIVKEIFTLWLAVNYNGDVMTPLNMFGLVVCLLGIILHVTIKLRHQPNHIENDLNEEKGSDWLLADEEDEEIVLEMLPHR